MAIGFRVYTHRNLPSNELIKKFQRLPTAPVADCMERSHVLSTNIRRMSPPTSQCIVGTALTVRTRSGDNLMLHKALDMATEGDILVVENGGCQDRALMGEVMFSYAVYKKLAGIIIDGPIRDLDSLEKLPLPVYATGTTPAGPFKEGPGEINVSISCGGVVVCPGDIILADSDGVIVIPIADAANLLIKATAFVAQDAAKVSAALEGTANRDWVDVSLRAKGCEFI